jgi:regulator of protease activity HflC (stomatin/prohibitin superfamily)
MEQQVRAEREKRAEILNSEGERESRINSSRGERQEAINLSQGERQRVINEAEGKAKAIETVAEATAEGIREVAAAIKLPKGRQAVSLRIAEQFISQLGDILHRAETSVLPYEAAHLKGMLESVVPGLRLGAGGSDEQAVPTTSGDGNRNPSQGDTRQ